LGFISINSFLGFTINVPLRSFIFKISSGSSFLIQSLGASSKNYLMGASSKKPPFDGFFTKGSFESFISKKFAVA
jgi:hypothetical protein